MRSEWVRLGLLGAGLAAVAVFLVVRGVPTLDEVRSSVDRAGAWAPLLFVVFFALGTLAVLPVTVFALVAGLLFGPVAGALLVWLGAMLGSTACFGVGRGLSRPAVRRLTSGRAAPAMARLEGLLSRRGFLAVVTVRLLPVTPFGPSSYLAGATALRTRDFVLGTAVGIVPSVVAYTVLGGTADQPRSPAFVASAAAVVLLIVVTTVLGRRARSR